MTAKEPKKSDYRGWQMQKYYEDSLAWKTNPLFGWCAKNKKKDGTNYNIYTDGLKIYTTIDSRMQKYAEELFMNMWRNTCNLVSSRKNGKRKQLRLLIS